MRSVMQSLRARAAVGRSSMRPRRPNASCRRSTNCGRGRLRDRANAVRSDTRPPMAIDVYFADWLSLILRWAHIITGIAWIGSSFYFIWLDARLNVPPRNPEHPEVAGDLWAVHGGGFYHAQKYKLAPALLPEPLHWFKWEAYFTWMTGFALFIVVYYVNAEAMLRSEERRVGKGWRSRWETSEMSIMRQ